MKIGQAGIDLIKEFEGCKLVAYLDSVGIPTIGYGRTKDVKIGDSCTKEEAEAWLKEDVHDAETCVNEHVTAQINQNEFDALVSFVFNLGCGNFRKSTLLRKLNDSDFDGASLEFARWNRAGGLELAGLTRRRAAEAELFDTEVA